MAGTRLTVHATFMIQLVFLIVAALFFALMTNNGLLSSVEPFFVDRSGWTMLNEDVTPFVKNDSGGTVLYMNEFFEMILSSIESSLGLPNKNDNFKNEDKPTSAFVHEIRHEISKLPLTSPSIEGNKSTNIFPQLKLILKFPRYFPDNGSKLHYLADALQVQLQKDSGIPLIVTYSETDTILNATSKDPCEDWNSFYLPFVNRINAKRRRIYFPEIIILTGCSVDPSSFEFYQYDGNFIFRTMHNIGNMEEHWGTIEQLFVHNISSILSGIISGPSPPNSYKMKSLYIELIDENPSTYASNGTLEVVKLTSKLHFEYLREAFMSSVTSVVNPFLHTLSFLYGGEVEIDCDRSINSKENEIKFSDSIHLFSHASAYLALPDNFIESSKSDDDLSDIHYVSTERIVTWINEHLSHMNDNTDIDHVQWIILLPSLDHSPLIFFEQTSDESGFSITLKRKIGTAYPSALSIITLDVPLHNCTDEKHDLDRIRRKYEEAMSSSLLYMIGYVRSLHGLPPASTQHYKERSQIHADSQTIEWLSYWEIEALARYQWHSTLELVLKKTDETMSLLNDHSRSIAFPLTVAEKINNATNLIRYSISLSMQGFPTMYSTSLLFGSLRYLEEAQSDPFFMELPHFAMDHYLAVFSPLVLPLLMPMIVGLFREIKRIRHLMIKKVKVE